MTTPLRLDSRSLLRLLTLALGGFLTLIPLLRADAVDDAVTALIAKRHIPGLSLAIIQDGKIVKTQGYGVIESGQPARVTAETLFQAGSVSKPVAALGALALVESGKLTLDADINTVLKSWQVPENTYTKTEKVTLRRLLSHSGGLTVHGFAGYAVEGPLPTLTQILNGEKPANSAPIRVDFVPGSKWRYAGGGYTVMQQSMIDVTGQTFAKFMHQNVLVPLGMQASSYDQPCPPRERRSPLRATTALTERSLDAGTFTPRWLRPDCGPRRPTSLASLSPFRILWRGATIR